MEKRRKRKEITRKKRIRDKRMYKIMQNISFYQFLHTSVQIVSLSSDFQKKKEKNEEQNEENKKGERERERRCKHKTLPGIYQVSISLRVFSSKFSLCVVDLERCVWVRYASALSSH